MPSGVRMLLIIVVGGGGFLLSLIGFGIAGLTSPPIQIPAATFLATVALWPLLRDTMAHEGRSSFVDWVAYNAALMLLLGLVMYGVRTWSSATSLIAEYSK